MQISLNTTEGHLRTIAQAAPAVSVADALAIVDALIVDAHERVRAVALDRYSTRTLIASPEFHRPRAVKHLRTVDGKREPLSVYVDVVDELRNEHESEGL